MANEMDELLGELKAEYEAKKTRNKSQSAPPPKPPSPKNDSDESEFDELLADIKSEVEAEAKGSSRNLPEPSLSETKPAEQRQFYEELRQQQQARERQAAQKRQQQQAREREAAQKRQREAAIAAQKRAEHRELRRKAALKDKAREWLKNLNFDSEEGRWFEEFAYSYDSQLDAAIDYLQAMRESGL